MNGFDQNAKLMTGEEKLSLALSERAQVRERRGPPPSTLRVSSKASSPPAGGSRPLNLNSETFNVYSPRFVERLAPGTEPEDAHSPALSFYSGMSEGERDREREMAEEDARSCQTVGERFGLKVKLRSRVTSLRPVEIRGSLSNHSQPVMRSGSKKLSKFAAFSESKPLGDEYGAILSPSSAKLAMRSAQHSQQRLEAATTNSLRGGNGGHLAPVSGAKLFPSPWQGNAMPPFPLNGSTSPDGSPFGEDIKLITSAANIIIPEMHQFSPESLPNESTRLINADLSFQKQAPGSRAWGARAQVTLFREETQRKVDQPACSQQVSAFDAKRGAANQVVTIQSSAAVHCDPEAESIRLSVSERPNTTPLTHQNPSTGEKTPKEGGEFVIAHPFQKSKVVEVPRAPLLISGYPVSEPQSAFWTPAKESVATKSEGEEIFEVFMEGVGRYIGGMANGAMEGRGKIIDLEGRVVYDGWFKANEFEGIGSLVNASASLMSMPADSYLDISTAASSLTEYNGQFARSLFHGLGAIKYADGAEFSGQFKEGRAEGVGLWSSTTEKINGVWSSDQLVSFL